MNVYVSGEFNLMVGIPNHLMKKDKEGVWNSKVKLLPGHYEYELFADNAWVKNLPDAETVSNPWVLRIS